MPPTKKFTILGQDFDVLVAVVSNIISWAIRRFVPRLLPSLLPTIVEEEGEEDDNEIIRTPATTNSPNTPQHLSSSPTKCVVIGRPGGKEQLRLLTLKPGYATCGYNLEHPSPFINVQGTLPPNTVVVRVHSFSINYADCCIRWGLYESANRFVGWPIVPGFDISGVVERVSDHYDRNHNHNHNHTHTQSFQVGDQVYGATFFGAYSTRVLVPTKQLRKLPKKGLTLSQAAALPAVSLTALYSLYLGGQYPSSLACRPSNRSILIHSAAGGVGSMLIQMSKLVGMETVVGVVGRTAKVDAANALGCDVVIDKSQEDLWKAAETASPNGYAVVADANGVSTLQASFDHLAPTGRLIVFGFHSNLPMGKDMLSPWEWMRMVRKLFQMPKFDPMWLTASNKSVLGFNLSFFVQEIDMLGQLYDQIGEWLESGQLECPRVVIMDMSEIAAAHDLIQSGKSIGKIVLQTNAVQI